VVLLWESLAVCYPVADLHQHAMKAAATVRSSFVLDKLQLFLKEVDLMDEGLPFLGTVVANNDHDVVTKEALGDRKISVCVRCGGKSHTVSVRTNPGRLLWWNRCVCGGDWRSL
jgi:hypothetical protein